MLVTSFAACGTKNDGEEPSETVTQAPTGQIGEGTTEGATEANTDEFAKQEAEVYRPEQLNWGTADGPYEFRMLANAYLDYFRPVETLEGDAVNTALYDRADFLEENFNIAFEVVTPTGNYSNLISTSCSAGRDFADAVIQWAADAYSAQVPAGHYLNVLDLDGLNLEASYWDQRIQKDYLIQDKLYALEGDFSLADEICTQVILFNAKLYENYGYKTRYGSPYTMVSNKKWTFSTMLEMYQGTSKIITAGAETLGKGDIWGMLSESQAPYVLFAGSGRKIAESVDGEISLVVDNDYQETYNVIADIMTRFGTDKECLFVGCWNGGVLTGDVWAEVSAIFEADHALFRSTALSAVTRLRDMESTFGVLPIPLYYENQESYHSLLGIHTPLFVPVTVRNRQHLEVTQALIEAMCYYSRYMDIGVSLYDAFYENMTYVKLCRSEEDRLMLQLIFANKTYELDKTMNFVGVANLLSNMMTSGEIVTLSSDMKNLQESAYINLKDFMDKLNSKNKA
jgi:hypothetical protein